MRVAVIGAGAIGCLFGARLRASGNDVLVIARDSATAGQIRKRGVRVREPDGTILRVQMPVGGTRTDLKSFELVVFAVKAYSTGSAAAQYAGHVGRGAKILTLQNGLGNVEVLSGHFGKSRVLAGSTSEASLLLEPGLVAHTGRGQTVLGTVHEGASSVSTEIVNMFRGAGFESKVTRNVLGVVWAKAIVNSAINPVSALTRLRNGDLLELSGIEDILRRVVNEGVSVSKKEGVRLEPPDPQRLLLRILKTSARNRSSMLQDVLRGGRTEIRELNGAIAERGRRHGVSTPCNQLLTLLVVGLERGVRGSKELALRAP